MLKCGLLGKTLGHSRSPEIHKLLGNYSYQLYEMPENEVEDFILHGDWDGLNVTIPYKKTVLPFLDELSPVAARVGSVNTIIRRADHSLFGDNTDVAGFEGMVRFSRLPLSGEKALVLGSGGASVAVCEALRRLGSEPIIISRSGENNYQNLSRHADVRFLVNTTPVGMFPNINDSPLDLSALPRCAGVLDIIYNPPVTKLMRQALDLGIPAFNGLWMLVAQAKASSELFTGLPIPDSRIEEVFRAL